MRRTALSSAVLTLLAVLVIGAQPCGTLGPTAKTFGSGSLVIPMDNCYQKRDATGVTGGQTVGCNTSSDDGVFRAYGLVYFLLKNNVPVYWAIDNTKASTTAADMTVTASSGVVTQKMSWADGSFADVAGLGRTISYIGGPFIVDAADVTSRDVVSMLQSNPDFAQFKREGLVDVHKVLAGFSASQVRPLSGPPPKIAILNIAGPKTSADVMLKYAQAAGFDWSCSGACTGTTDCECAGGISKLDANCTKSKILTNYGITVNNGPGLVYDILCDQDFLPDYTTTPPDFGKATLLKKDAAGNYVYKLLWAPHWESPRAATCPAGTVNPSGKTVACGTTPDPYAAAGSAGRKLADWLACIRAFVDAGNNLFAECHAIATLEGGFGLMDTANPIKEYGLPVTRFQTSAGMNRSLSVSIAANAVAESIPTEPYMQIADFTFSGTNGNVSAFLADPNGNSIFSLPGSTYGGIQRYIAQNNATPNLDILTSIKFGGETGRAGAVVYMGGHDYSTQTAGTRIVLNTLFNLGFGCADPNTACQVPGQFGECAKGTLKCTSSGGLQCVQASPSAGPGAQDDCARNLDLNCDGHVTCNPAQCTPGATRACLPPVPGQRMCNAGTQTCNAGGFWNDCVGQVLPTPEVCNGKDDDCNGVVDDGNLCPTGSTCTNGVCLPATCNGENVQCPEGYTCNLTTHACDAKLCPATACPAGAICRSGACVDPCAGVTCGPGASCSGGVCIGGGCALAGCPGAGQRCVNGFCVADPCAGTACPDGTFCRLGDCVRSCAYVDCPPGQQCGVDGFCQSVCSPACPAGQICVNGACSGDPCAGVACGSSQVCRNGACLDDPCANVACPAPTSCSGGQCIGGGIQRSTQHDVPEPSSGGCGSTGAGGLLSLVALAGLCWIRRRPSARAPAGAPRVAGAAVAAAILVVAAGCKSKASAPTCPTGQTACGSSCVGLATATDNCGACGRTCLTGFQCQAGACVKPTGNPFLTGVDPGVLGKGDAPTLHLTGEGFQQGAVVRISGPGPTQEKPLSNLTATSADAGIDLSGYGVGSAEVRVLNPGRLVSNAVPVTIQVQTILRAFQPPSAASVQQDGSTAVSFSLLGSGFAPGAVATLTGPLPATTSQSLTTTYADANTVTVSNLVPSALALGIYDLRVTNAGGMPTTALKFTVNEGAPVVTSLAPTCTTPGPGFSGIVNGNFLYPSSVVVVVGSAIGTSTLPSTCLAASGTTAGIDALGQCTGGQLRVSADLSATPPSCYQVKVVNPGPQNSVVKYVRVANDCSNPAPCP
jgi:hypothetical protein